MVVNNYKNIFDDRDIFLLLHTYGYYQNRWGINKTVNRTEKMSKQVFTLEYPVRCSPTILYEFLSTPAGLQEWFAEKVDERDGVFSFTWNGTTDKAEMLDMEEDKFIRFHWVHAPKNEYFEFSIEKSEVSNQTILVIKDFSEKKEIPDQKRLWDFQVNDLFYRIGS
ncbi:MAG: START-like domain-containing protein [Chitinophagaceae bacterium]